MSNPSLNDTAAIYNPGISSQDLISDDETLRTNSYRYATLGNEGAGGGAAAGDNGNPAGSQANQSAADSPVKYPYRVDLETEEKRMAPSTAGTNGSVLVVPDNGGQETPNLCLRFLKDLSDYKAGLVLVLTPILACPLLFLNSKEATCGFCVIIMAAYWMFEVMPLAATALIPTFLFPMLGVLTSKEVCKAYLPDTNFLFIGGLIVAVAVERCNLHQRIALRVLTIVGSQPKWIMLGFMSVTAFLSMWISNTATTAMMVPIAQSVIEELLKHRINKRRRAEAGEEMANLIVVDSSEKHLQRRQSPAEEEQEEGEQQGDIEFDPSLLTRAEKDIAKGMLICIAFAANIGGTGTITGTPPNLVTVGILEKTYPDGDTGITYASWIQFAVPLMLVSVILCWLSLVAYFLGFKALLPGFLRRGAASSDSDKGVEDLLKQKFRDLPRMSFAEWSVLCCFIILLLMWIFRDPKEIPGFGELFPKDKAGNSYFKDATSAMLIAVVLFALPNQMPDFLCFRGRNVRRAPRLRGALMDWKSMQEKFPWSVVLLLGGGFALAAGVKQSGLSAVVGQILRGLSGMNVIGVQFICVVITMGITNICSNTVTASIFVPIVAGLAETLKVHPLQLVLPVALACSFAFCLPVATPPNAIVFASGMLSVADMMKSGLLISLVSVVLIVLNQQTYTRLVFPLGTFPEWANSSFVPS